MRVGYQVNFKNYNGYQFESMVCESDKLEDILTAFAQQICKQDIVVDELVPEDVNDGPVIPDDYYINEGDL